MENPRAGNSQAAAHQPDRNMQEIPGFISPDSRFD
jgi:hypothetical protein